MCSLLRIAFYFTSPFFHQSSCPSVAIAVGIESATSLRVNVPFHVPELPMDTERYAFVQ